MGYHELLLTMLDSIVVLLAGDIGYHVHHTGAWHGKSISQSVYAEIGIRDSNHSWLFVAGLNWVEN